MFRSTIKTACSKRFQSTLNLQSELQRIQKAKYLKDTNTKEIFPATAKPSASIFPKIESIDPSKDLQTKPFNNTVLGSYYISKTTTGRLPVYSEIRRGQVRETVIRRIEGDVVLLKKDLLKALPVLHEDEVKVLQESKKIVIRGDYVGAVRNVLRKVL